MTGNLEMTERQTLEGSYSQETPQKRAKSTKKEVKTMKNEKKTVDKEILNQNNANEQSNKGEIIMNENLSNGNNSEPNVFTIIDLNADLNTITGEINQKKETIIMDTQKEVMAKGILYKQATIDNFIKCVNSEYEINDKILLRPCQYNILKPIFDATNTEQKDVMKVLMKYFIETRDCKIYCFLNPCPDSTDIQDEVEIRKGIVSLSFPNKPSGNWIIYRNIKAITLFDFVARKMYGGLH